MWALQYFIFGYNGLNLAPLNNSNLHKPILLINHAWQINKKNRKYEFIKNCHSNYCVGTFGHNVHILYTVCIVYFVYVLNEIRENHERKKLKYKLLLMARLLVSNSWNVGASIIINYCLLLILKGTVS